MSEGNNIRDQKKILRSPWIFRFAMSIIFNKIFCRSYELRSDNSDNEVSILLIYILIYIQTVFETSILWNIYILSPNPCSMKESSPSCSVSPYRCSCRTTPGDITLTHQLLSWVSKGHKKQTASPANSLSMTLSIFLFRRRKKPSLSLLLLLVFNSGSFLIDRYWLSGRQHAREKEREWGCAKEISYIGRTKMWLKRNC